MRRADRVSDIVPHVRNGRELAHRIERTGEGCEMAPGEPAVSHLSPAEIEAAINQLSSADFSRLRKLAGLRSRVGPMVADDLLQEAFVRALDGSRKCPRHVDIIRFLGGVMHSIASDAVKAQNRRPLELRLVPASSGDDELPLLDPPDPRANAEDEIAAGQIRREIIALFDDDLAAQTIAEGMMDGMEGEELRSCTGLDEKAFATMRRLVRRRIDKAFPKGRKP
jgi:RNA polymerase sigma-70 factor (ECF subfamily)